MLDVYKFSHKSPAIIIKGDDTESFSELKEMFILKHQEWEAVNNPAGYNSGEVQKKWETRLQVLLNLVRKGQVTGKF